MIVSGAGAISPGEQLAAAVGAGVEGPPEVIPRLLYLRQLGGERRIAMAPHHWRIYNDQLSRENPVISRWLQLKEGLVLLLSLIR
jgi:hypothetical protein